MQKNYQKSFCLAFFAIFTVFIFSHSSLISQVDTARFEVFYDSIDYYLDRDLDKSIPMIEAYVEESRKVNYRKGIIFGLQDLGWVYVEQHKLEKADSFYYAAIHEAEQDANHKQIGYTYQRMLQVSKRLDKPYEAIDRFRLSIEHYLIAGDTSHLCEQYLQMGHFLNGVDEDEEALRAYDQAYRLCDAIDDHEYVGFTLDGVGSLHSKRKDYKAADSIYQISFDLFKVVKNDRYKFMVLVNRGIAKKNQGDVEGALSLYNQVLEEAEESNFEHTIASIKINRAIALELNGAYSASLKDAQDALTFYEGVKWSLGQSEALQAIAKAELGLGNYNTAVKYSLLSIEKAKLASSINKQMDMYKTLATIYKSKGDYKNAIVAESNYSVMRDSFFDFEKSKQVHNLQQKYANHMQKTENQVLTAELNLAQSRRTQIGIAFAALSMLAGGVLLYMVQRRRKDRILFMKDQQLKEQELNLRKLEKENLQKELDFKQQELLASALQLYNKNESLVRLSQQVSNLKSEAGKSNTQTIDKIARSIENDLESNAEWDSFLQTFSDIHLGFINRLKTDHPDLTQNQIRFVCLMKLNLSSREMASMLNISAEGIKKAKHRLKKKLGLGADEKIEDFINHYSLDPAKAN